jgi:hypothetical protein
LTRTKTTRAKRTPKKPGAAAAAKVDLYRDHATEYVKPRSPALVRVGRAKYFAVEGAGDPGGEAFGRAIGALYTVAFTVKMHSKFAGRDYAVTKLEALWWGDDPNRLVIDQPHDRWHWKVMIRIPDFIDERRRLATVEGLLAKGKDPAVSDVYIETLDEGTCVQALHVGPYEQERDTIAKMKAFAAEKGLAYRGHHHEIYLSDPRRVQPAKLRTILRQPVG